LQRVNAGNWTEYRSRSPRMIEVDFHFADYNPRHYGPRESTFSDYMEQAARLALESLCKAYERGLEYVLFTHGHSTSRMGRTSARSQVRAMMRSKEATPYINRRASRKDNSVFLAAIRVNARVNLPELKCPTCGNRDIQPRSCAGHFRCRDSRCLREFNWFDLSPSPRDTDSGSGSHP
jgi:hypothetical protein